MQTNAELFKCAVFWAQERQGWMRLARDGHFRLTRLQCLQRARKAERHVVGYAISAELRAEHEFHAAQGAA